MSHTFWASVWPSSPGEGTMVNLIYKQGSVSPCGSTTSGGQSGGKDMKEPARVTDLSPVAQDFPDSG